MAMAADENTAVVVEVVPGQTGDAPLWEPMLERTIERVPHCDELDGDRGHARSAWPLTLATWKAAAGSSPRT